MAKSNALRSGGRSHIRFIMLDADLNEGELNQVTQAIQNALVPTSRTPPTLRLVSSGPHVQPADATSLQDEAAVTEGAESVEMEEVEEETRQVSRPRPRKYRTPKAIEVDVKKDVSLEAYAQTKKCDSDFARFLVVAAWLKEHRGIDVVTVDHIYSCFRLMEWPIGIPDFSQPLRDMKRRQLFEARDGGYAITHLGLARASKKQ